MVTYFFPQYDKFGKKISVTNEKKTKIIKKYMY